MFKKSLLAACAILACTLAANQAQAVTQTIQWNFTVLTTHLSTLSYNSQGLLPGMVATDDDVTLSGGTTSSATAITSPFAGQVQGSTTGTGVFGLNDAFIDQISFTSFEFLTIDLLNPLAFITSHGLSGTWSMRFNSIGATESATVLTSNVNNAASTQLLVTGNSVLNTAFLDFNLNPVQQYLYVRQTGNSVSSVFQVSGLRFTYDDGCPVGGCPAPEPGMVGLLGLSLFGLAFLRKKQ